jgi:hypothetical protein
MELYSYFFFCKNKKKTSSAAAGQLTLPEVRTLFRVSEGVWLSGSVRVVLRVEDLQRAALLLW